MKYLKTFEELDFNQTTDAVAVSDLTNYYNCDDCKALFKIFNKQLNHCPYCRSKNLKNIGSDSYYSIESDRLDADEKELSKKHKEEEEK
jgi:DNA-directed RNA polymerase subunit RPC12/RpoP